MLDATPKAVCPAHAPSDHPKLPQEKVGILIANLGTPDNYDYWSMRRYLGEFLSDQRVIDYSPWLWQPLLQLVILTKRPFSSGAAYKSIWNHEAGESPLMTITKQQTAKISSAMEARFGDSVMVDFCMRYGNPSTKSKVRAMVEAGCRKILFFPSHVPSIPISSIRCILRRWPSRLSGHTTRQTKDRTSLSALITGFQSGT